MDDEDFTHSPSPPKLPGTIPRAKLAREDLDAGDSFELWRESARPVFDSIAEGQAREFHAEYDIFQVDGLIFCRNLYSACRYVRNQSHIRGNEQDFITLHLPLRGTERGIVDGRDFTMAPDRVTLLDWAKPYASRAEDTEKLGVVIPRSRVAARDRIYERSPAIEWKLNSMAGRLLSSSWQALMEGLPTMAETQAPSVAAGFLGLLNGLLADGDPADTMRTGDGIAAAMKRFLKGRLNDPRLGLESLTLHFGGFSRSTIYRLFEDCGGVSAFIREQRLVAAYGALANDRTRRLPIAEIALRFGFPDANHFHRLFKQRFGMTPGDLRQIGLYQDGVDASLASDHEAVRTVNGWLSV